VNGLTKANEARKEEKPIGWAISSLDKKSSEGELSVYELVVAVMVLAGIQYTFAWRFHGIYIGLHDKFARTVEDAKARKLNEFNDAFFSFLQVVGEDLKARGVSFPSLSREQTAAVSGRKEYMDGISKLTKITESREAIGAIYKAARENARTVYTFLMISGSASLLGLLPATGSGDTMWYEVFALPLIAVLLAWSDYHRYEAKLVKLRDEPLNV
jgi:hypothetical protein